LARLFETDAKRKGENKKDRNGDYGYPEKKKGFVDLMPVCKSIIDNTQRRECSSQRQLNKK